MGYLGLTPTTAQQNYLNIDDISGSFNGSTTSFALLTGGVAPSPFPVTNSCLISVGGVIQEPDDTGTSGFRISGSNIVFSSAPGTGEDFFGLVLAGADYLNVGANFPDGTVGTPSITFDSDTNTGIYHPSADELSIVTGGSDRVRVDSNGRLGIGTASPTTFVHCSESTNGVTSLSVENSNTGTSARADIIAVSDSADVRFIATSAAYTGVSGWADSGIVSTSSGASGGLILNAQAGGIKFSYGASERARIDSSGRLLLGITSTAGSNEQLQVMATTGAQVGLGKYANDTRGAYFQFHKSRGSLGNHGLVSSGDEAGQILFNGSDGTFYRACSTIEAWIDGTATTGGAMPGRLVFSTTAGGATSPTERLRITSDGTLQLRNSPGIDFSQIQTNASGVISETLDSYEEGRFTPRLNGYTGSTYANVTNTTSNEPGLYIKVGRSVTVFIRYQYTSMPIGQNRPWYIYDLPFAPSTQNAATGAVYFDNITNAYSLVVSKNAGSAEPLFLQARTSNSATNPNLTYSGSSGFLNMSITYWTDS